MVKAANVRSGPAHAGERAVSEPAAPTGEAAALTPTSKVDEITVTDERGRAITIKKLGPLLRTRLFKIVGADNSRNAMLMGMYLMAAGVTRVDDRPFMFPARESDIEVVLDLLGDEGIDAISSGWVEAGWVKTDEGDPANIKN